MDRSPSSLRLVAAAAWIVPVVLQAVVVWRFSSTVVYDAPTALFVIVLIAASLCAVAAAAVVGRAWRRNEAELALTGAFFWAVSVLPLAHGVTTPGVLYEDNVATSAPVFWAIPMALLSASPLVFPRRLRGALLARWRLWTIAVAGATTTMAAMSLINTDLLPGPNPGATWTTTVAVLSVIGCFILAIRHVRLAEIARSRIPLVVCLGYAFVGSSALVWLGAVPYSTGFWAAHALDIAGVFAGALGALFAYRQTGTVRAVLDPVLVTDPRAAFELGLDPTVHRFVADLEAKDANTRDHVVRTAELAIAVGEAMGLPSHELRVLGVGAILHDVGKLEIPEWILTKPGALTDVEFETMRQHVIWGHRLVVGSSVLTEAAPIVRGHHERIDGGGYPDGLSGDDIPLGARIVSACDAFDAMAHSRHYREGMGRDRAIEILRQHAGKQWDTEIVEVVVTVSATLGIDGSDRPQHLDQVGRVGCDCLPEQVITTEDSVPFAA